MIPRLSAAIVGLLAFLGTLAAGYLAGNALTTILVRSLLGLLCGLAAGYLAGRVSQVVVDESFRKMVEADEKAIAAEQAPEAGANPVVAEEKRAVKAG